MHRIHAGQSVIEGAQGDRLLVFLHGMGATAAVWSAMVERARWDGRWAAIDLPGHGGSATMASYAISEQAAVLAEAIAALAAGHSVTLLGHSLGGVLALEIANGRYGILPERAFGLGVKVDWTDDERARMNDLATRPARIFRTEDEALAAYCRQSGLGDVREDARLVARGVVEAEGGWQLAMDNEALAVGNFDFGELVGASACPVHLGCGASDHMVTIDRLRNFDPFARAIEGAGHNAMVDRPDASWNWLAAA